MDFRLGYESRRDSDANCYSAFFIYYDIELKQETAPTKIQLVYPHQW